MTVNNFDVLKEMTEQSFDTEASLKIVVLKTMEETNLAAKKNLQIINARARGDRVTVTMIADGQTMEENDFILLVYNKEQFEMIKRQMERKLELPPCKHCGGT
jgi:hypothetical protein